LTLIWASKIITVNSGICKIEKKKETPATICANNVYSHKKTCEHLIKELINPEIGRVQCEGWCLSFVIPCGSSYDVHAEGGYLEQGGFVDGVVLCMEVAK
jgi:hypothetical protein